MSNEIGPKNVSQARTAENNWAMPTGQRKAKSNMVAACLRRGHQEGRNSTCVRCGAVKDPSDEITSHWGDWDYLGAVQ